MTLASSMLGLRIAHPFVAGASPLGRDLDTIRRLEDGGAAAIVLPSLFEEQITLAAERAASGTWIRSTRTSGPAAEAFPSA